MFLKDLFFFIVECSIIKLRFHSVQFFYVCNFLFISFILFLFLVIRLKSHKIKVSELYYLVCWSILFKDLFRIFIIQQNKFSSKKKVDKCLVVFLLVFLLCHYVNNKKNSLTSTEGKSLLKMFNIPKNKMF